MTTQAPLCPTHHSAMRAGKRGGWFCPRQVGDGYCDQRMSDGQAEALLRSRDSAPPASTAGFVATTTTASSSDSLAAACLELAGRCYAATPQAFQNTPTMAVTFAIQALAAMKAVS